MATEVIMPVLGVAQEYGKITRWYKRQGEQVNKGEPLLEVETDKAVVDIEAPASGILAQVVAFEGQDVPVTQAVAVILAPGEKLAAPASLAPQETSPALPPKPPGPEVMPMQGQGSFGMVSPLAARIAAQHGVDLAQVKSAGERIEKDDVLAYLASRDQSGVAQHPQPPASTRPLASPKARRIAAERGVNLASLKGSGPEGAVLAIDVPLAAPALERERGELQALSTAWRLMAQRTAQSWTSVPHFFLLREVNASRLVSWRESLSGRPGEKITYTDLLVRVIAYALRQHPAINATWQDETVVRLPGIHIGLVTAQEDGLVAPVIHDAERLTIRQIAAARAELVERARQGRLRPQDIVGGTFTISNLGMYGVDAFTAIINAPQAAILAVGRIAERVTAVSGLPVVQPMLTLSLSCDHRVIDGVRGARFLDDLVGLIEEPARLVD